MNKTPEEMAEEYAEIMSFEVRVHQRGFLAGYNAAAPKWISVKERLPEDGIEVLFYSSKTQMNCCFVGYRAQENEYLDPEGNGLILREIEKYYTHWMPLPEPPKEKE
jgi:hypothetical protein